MFAAGGLDPMSLAATWFLFGAGAAAALPAGFAGTGALALR